MMRVFVTELNIDKSMQNSVLFNFALIVWWLGRPKLVPETAVRLPVEVGFFDQFFRRIWIF
jgi:hypothetical protein